MVGWSDWLGVLGEYKEGIALQSEQLERATFPHDVKAQSHEHEWHNQVAEARKNTANGWMPRDAVAGQAPDSKEHIKRHKCD